MKHWESYFPQKFLTFKQITIKMVSFITHNIIFREKIGDCTKVDLSECQTRSTT